MSRTAAVAGLGLVLAMTACSGPKRMPPVTGDGVPPAPELAVPILLGVGLAEGRDEIVVAAAGPALLKAGDGGGTLATVADGERIVCRRKGEHVAWTADAAAGEAATLVLEPLDPDHRVVHGEERYRGRFLVRTTPETGGLTLVNELELEAYLRGVVPWEIGRHGRERLSALEAQAIAARTYTVSHLGVRAARGFDLFASVMDQVYRGSAGEDPLCNEAVESTAGLVLRHGGVEIQAYYSACCGGVTSAIAEVWPMPARPYLVSHRDGPPRGPAHCAESRWSSWEERWTGTALEAIVQETLPAYVDHMAQNGRAEWAGPTFTPRAGGSDPDRPGTLRNLEILRRTTSGRIAHLAVVTDAGTYHVRGDRVRWVLKPASGQPAILRSARFDLDVGRTDQGVRAVVISGRGYGHGIGMCQTGALAMAGQGHDVASILRHYYPGTLLARLAP